MLDRECRDGWTYRRAGTTPRNVRTPGKKPDAFPSGTGGRRRDVSAGHDGTIVTRVRSETKNGK